MRDSYDFRDRNDEEGEAYVHVTAGIGSVARDASVD